MAVHNAHDWGIPNSDDILKISEHAMFRDGV